MPTDLPESARTFLTVLGVFAALALAGMAMRTGRGAYYIGLIAAAAAVLTTLAFWLISPHTPWTHLLFQLFPAPALDESARLIALFALPAAALREPREWIAFALGFAALEAGASAWLSLGTAAAPALLAPLVVLTLHFTLGLAALAIRARNAPPLLIFCVLALVHGGINGGWIAALGALSVWAVLAAEAAAIILYVAAAILLLRGSDALRGEDRGLD